MPQVSPEQLGPVHIIFSLGLALQTGGGAHVLLLETDVSKSLLEDGVRRQGPPLDTGDVLEIFWLKTFA